MTIDQQQAIQRFKEIGLEDVEKQLDPYTQTGIFGDLEMGKISDEDFRQGLSEMIGHEVTWEQCRYAWLGYCKEVPQRNLDKLVALKEQGYRVVLLSNTNPFMMSWVMSEAFDGNGHSLEYYLDAAYMSYKCKVMKPDEMFFRKVLMSERLNPETTLFVDDGPRNVAAASELGIRTFCPENGADWTDELDKYLEY